MLTLVYWCALGSIAGGVAKAIMPNKLPPGWVPTIAVGVLGSVAGGLPFGQGSSGLIGSVVGACVILSAYGVFRDDS